MTIIYHDGNRVLQDEFDSRRLADRLVDVIVHEEIEKQARTCRVARSVFYD